MLSDEEIKALCKVQDWRIEENDIDFMRALGIAIVIRDEKLNVIGRSSTALQEAYKEAVKNFNDDVHIATMVDEDFELFENLKR